MWKQRQARLGRCVCAAACRKATWPWGPISEALPAGGPKASRAGSGAPSLKQDPSLLIQTKAQLDVISDGKETLDVMWKHVVCREELDHDFLHTRGAIPSLMSLPRRVFQ